LNSEFHDSPSYEKLKKLTDDVSCKKSIPPTPTRALSSTTARSDNSGGEQGSHSSNGQGSKSLKAEAVPIPPTIDKTASQAGAPKGKLTVKIAEARGIRRSRDPYVVAVFQRNELVSKGPLPTSEDDHEEATSTSMMNIPMGGIPISRSGSESGRPMAIPMKSRQSSNTSFGGDFKFNGKSSITHPKWDTEAVL
jgi:protein-serine/threonine kinase